MYILVCTKLFESVRHKVQVTHTYTCTHHTKLRTKYLLYIIKHVRKIPLEMCFLSFTFIARLQHHITMNQISPEIKSVYCVENLLSEKIPKIRGRAAIT